MEKRAGSLKKFGEILMAAGLITDEQLALAVAHARLLLELNAVAGLTTVTRSMRGTA